MKHIYSTTIIWAMMMAAMSFTACGDDNDDGEGSSEYEYFQITINGETTKDDGWGGSWFAYYEPIRKNGEEVYFYGGMTDQIDISDQDGMQCNIFAGYTTEDLGIVYPKSTGTYDIVCEKRNERYTDYGDNIGMVLTGGNMIYRTVTSGSLKITKVSKVKSATAKMLFGREYGYATEGTFSFTLTDNWDGNENKISGKFRLVF